MLTVPVAGPGEATSALLPAELLVPAGPGETWLTIIAELAADAAWAPSGHVVASAQFDRSASPVAAGSTQLPGSAAASDTEAELVVGGGVFDPTTGRLLSLYELPVDGPRLELWRGPTDNDRSDSRGSYELGDPEETGGEGVPGPSSEQRWRDRGLDRLTHRVLSISNDHDRAGCPGPQRCGRGNAVRRHDLHLDPGWRRRPRSAGGDQPLAGLGLHLAEGRRPLRPADRGRPGGLVRHRAERVLPRHRPCRAGRTVRGGSR